MPPDELYNPSGILRPPAFRTAQFFYLGLAAGEVNPRRRAGAPGGPWLVCGRLREHDEALPGGARQLRAACKACELSVGVYACVQFDIASVTLGCKHKGAGV